MNKDQILEMSRQENKNKDLVEKSVENKAAVASAIAMIFLSLVFYAAEIVLQGRQNFGFFAMIALYNAIMFMTKGIKNKQKMSLIAGIIWIVTTIVFIVIHFNNLITESTIL